MKKSLLFAALFAGFTSYAMAGELVLASYNTHHSEGEK